MPIKSHNTMLVIESDGQEVGRVPAAAPNAEEYVNEMARRHPSLKVREEYNKEAGELAELYERMRRA